jgi:hypothetical protein
VISRNQIKLILIVSAVGMTLVLLAVLQANAANVVTRIIQPPSKSATAQSKSDTPQPVAAITPTVAPTETTRTIMVPAAETTGTQQVKVTVQCNDLIKNGDFEAPQPGRPWTGVANTPRAVYSAPVITTARAHSGSQSARIGSPALNYYWDELIQTVQLPAGVTDVTLIYWRYLDTSETSTTRAYDIFKVGLETQKGIQIVQPLQVDNTSDGRGAWVQRSLALPNASAYAGQRLWVTFKATTDGSLPSSLYIDDAQLIVCAAK